MKVGVIGCGNIFNLAHKYVLNQLKNEGEIEIVGCLDEDFQKAKEGALFLETTPYNDLEKFLSLNMDIVEILTPTSTHSKLAIKALESGKHVIVEKPMALTTADAKKMIETAQKTGKKLFVGHTRRFDHKWTQVKEEIKQKDIKPVEIKKSELQYLPFPPTYWYWKEDKSGGAILDIGVHAIDLVLWFFESKPISVYSIGKQIRKEAKQNNTFDHFLSILIFPDNRTGIIEVSWAHSSSKKLGTFYHYLDVVGKNGRIRYTPSESTTALGIIEEEISLPRFSKLLSTTVEAFKEEIRHFISCIKNNTTPRVTPKDAMVAVHVAECALKSAKFKKPVKISSEGVN